MMSLVLASCLSVAAMIPMVPGDNVVPAEGDPAPNFEGKWMSYKDSSLSELEGRLVFIEFWRTW